MNNLLSIFQSSSFAKTISFLFLTFTFSNYVFASGSQLPLSPAQEIETMGNNLFSRIANSQQELNKFPELMRDIVEQELMPTIDVKYAAYKVLGKHLKKTTKEQRKKFINSMDYYLTKTLASALNRYTNQQVIYGNGEISNNKKMASVGATIVDANKPDIHLTFQMRKNKKTGQWKAYDLVVEGISLLNTKQAEFNSRLTKYGIDQVTIELAALAK